MTVDEMIDEALEQILADCPEGAMAHFKAASRRRGEKCSDMELYRMIRKELLDLPPKHTIPLLCESCEGMFYQVGKELKCGGCDDQ